MLLTRDGGLLKTKLFGLAFKVSDHYRLCPYRAESPHDAQRHGMEQVLDRELVAVFSDEAGLTFHQMLELATVLP